MVVSLLVNSDIAGIRIRNTALKSSVAEPKLFISGSDFGHNFGSSSSYSHILALKTVKTLPSTILIEVAMTFSSF